MRIAVYCHNYPPHPGGLEAIVQSLAREQAQAGHAVQVVTTAWSGQSGETVESGVRITRLPAVHLSEPFGVPYPWPVSRLPTTTRAWLERADLHHAHGALYRTTRMAARFARRQRKPLVITEHVGFVPYSSPVVNWIEKMAWNRIGDRVMASAGAVVTYNQRVREWLQDRYSGLSVEFIPNGIDLEVFRPASPEERKIARREFGLPENEILALFVGREVAKKNLQSLLDRPRDTFRLVCCGTTRRLPEDVINLGLIAHARMAQLYRAMDFFVHLGVGEGFPVAIQEAGACGLPILLLWDSGYVGSLERADVLSIEGFDELSSACSRLARSETLRADLGERVRNRATHAWSWNRARVSYDDVYARAGANADPG